MIGKPLGEEVPAIPIQVGRRPWKSSQSAPGNVPGRRVPEVLQVGVQLAMSRKKIRKNAGSSRPTGREEPGHVPKPPPGRHPAQFR